MQQNKNVQKEVKMTRSQTRGSEGSQSPSAQMGVASPKAGSSFSVQLSSQVVRPRPWAVSCHMEPTLPPPRVHSEDVGSPVTMRFFLSPFVWRRSCGHGCDAFQWLHRVLQGGHTSAESAPLLTRIYLFPGVFVCFVLLPQY